MAGDGLAIGTGWLLSPGTAPSETRSSVTAAVVVAAIVVGVSAMHLQGLHLWRVSVVRSVELTRTARAVVLLAGAMLLIDRAVHLGLRAGAVVAAALISFLLLCVWRSIVRCSLTRARAAGRHLRAVIVIGAGADAARLVELCATHPEVGYLVAGVVGDRAEASVHGLSELWLGTVEETERVVSDAAASGVFVTPGAASGERVRELLRHLYTDNVHVQLTTALCGLDARRIRLLPLAHEPLFYVEAATLSPGRIVAKRVFDIVVSSILIILASPVILSVALAVRVFDRGPSFSVQQRVGRGGHPFGLLTFRTMYGDANRRLVDRRVASQRGGGPVTTTMRQPVTRIGRLLRESRLDGLPQLFNVLRGQMSLVGPRPAMPAEVVLPSTGRHDTDRVLPGLTGLWHVEARDNPSFAEHQRLDLFYVENWSTTLDLMIIVATIEQLVGRFVRMVVGMVVRRSTVLTRWSSADGSSGDVVDDPRRKLVVDRQVVERVVPDDRCGNLGKQLDIGVERQLAAGDCLAEQLPRVLSLAADDRPLVLGGQLGLTKPFGHERRQDGAVGAPESVDEGLHERTEVGAQVARVR